MSGTATLVARGITVSFGRAVILDEVDLTVAPGHRIGVVGPNGAGKSTLLKVLAGHLEAERGVISLAPPTATVGYLAQEPERRAGETVRAYLARRTGVGDAAAELERTTQALAADEPGAGDRYADALDRWLALGAADFDVRVGETWTALGLADPVLDRAMTELSGGQAARVSLAALLLSRYDVLLLDEPTNDLDFDGLDRLERFVAGLDAGTVIVSHDRAFLERTVTAVLELDEHTHRATRFDGGWLAYLDERAAARRHAEEDYATFMTARAELVARARRQRQWSDAGVKKAKTKATDPDKFIRHRRAQQSEKLAAKAKATERAIDRLDVVDKPWEGWDLRLEINAAPRSGAVVARLEHAVIERGEGDHAFRLGPLDLEVGWAERIAILGPNGSGKSTLISALLGRLPLTSGARYLGPGVVVGEIDQARARFEGERSLLDSFAAETGVRVGREARSLLAKFGLGPTHVERTTGSLSPGERTRAVLATLVACGVNCLVLDEPTNHLDLPAIEQLEQALASYEGTLLLVTHDRQLLDAVEVDRTIRLA